MINCKKVLLLVYTFLLITVSTIAQSTAPDTSAGNNGLMRSEGKIYVVMAVVIIILAGLILYVLRLDRKIAKLEKGDNF